MAEGSLHAIAAAPPHDAMQVNHPRPISKILIGAGEVFKSVGQYLYAILDVISTVLYWPISMVGLGFYGIKSLIQTEPLALAEQLTSPKPSIPSLQSTAIEQKNDLKKLDTSPLNEYGEKLLVAIDEDKFHVFKNLLAEITEMPEVVKKAIFSTKDFEGLPVLIHAVDRDNIKMVKSLIAAGAGFEEKAKDGSNVLAYAISLHMNETSGLSQYERGTARYQILEFLLTKAAELPKENLKAIVNGGRSVLRRWDAIRYEPSGAIMRRYNAGDTPLLCAVKLGKIDLIKAFVAGGASIEDTVVDQQNALSLAMKNHQVEIVEYLLTEINKKPQEAQESILDVQNKEGQTLLMQLIISGTLEMVERLVVAGANIHLKDKQGWSAVWYAVKHRHLEIVKYLHEHGAWLMDTDLEGRTLLMVPYSVHNLQGRDSEVLKYLLPEIGQLPQKQQQAFFKLGASEKDKNTWLICAIELGNVEIAKNLVAVGAKITAQDNKGMNPLMYAVTKGRSEIVEYFLAVIAGMLEEEQKASLNVKDKEGFTVLTWAVRYGRLKMVEDLIIAGARLDVQNNMKEDLMIVATRYDEFETLKYLRVKMRTQSDGSKTLMNAAQFGAVKTVKGLIAMGVSANGKHKNGWSPIWYAVQRGFLEIIKYLHEHGLSIRDRDNKNNSLLMVAAEHGHLSVLKYLLRQGVSVELKNDAGLSALDIARTVPGRQDVVRLLEQGLEDEKGVDR